jgi:hypothetical protein
MKNDILNAVVREIERRGGVVEAIRTAKGSHRMLYWRTLGGTKLVLTIPHYNGDWRSLNTARMNVRRQLREAQL